MGLHDKDVRSVLLLLKRMYGLSGMRQCCLLLKMQWAEEAMQQEGGWVRKVQRGQWPVGVCLMEGFCDGNIP